jgi:hypothetical protein
VPTDLGKCSTAKANVNLGTPLTGDNCGVASVVNDAPDPFPHGTTTVTWTVTDTSGNTSTATQKVTVKDHEKPALTLLGSSSVTAECHTGYTDAGATASDNCDGNITARILTVNPVDANTPGTYTVTYNVSDEVGNPATQVSRTVIVQDTMAPVLSANPANASYECLASVPSAPTLTASDNCDGTVAVTFTETQSNPGTSCHNKIARTWSAKDTHGNTTNYTQTITVNDDTHPTVAPVGASSMTAVCMSTFVDPGATATDNCGGNPTITTNVSILVSNVWQAVPAVNTSVAGTYQITYTATDSCGNASSCQRTVTVQYKDPSQSCTVSGSLTPGHTILQPINADGSSVWKQGSTVPAKFMVFDFNCNSVGPTANQPTVVKNFVLYQVVSGTIATVDEAVVSTTPDTAFRWDSTGQQWIFNISTKPLKANQTYIYQITLMDGSTIQFQFGLR